MPPSVSPCSAIATAGGVAQLHGACAYAASNVVTLLNEKTGRTGVTASSNGSGVSLVANDGRTISIGASYQGAAVDGAALGMSNLLGSTAPLSSADTSMSFISTLTLSSPSAFAVSSGSAGNGNFTAMGFKNGNLGASTDIVNLAKQDLSTQAGAKNVLNVINSAITWVSNQQTAVGGVLSAMDYQTSYLSNTRDNLTASLSNLRSNNDTIGQVTNYSTSIDCHARSSQYQQSTCLEFIKALDSVRASQAASTQRV